MFGVGNAADDGRVSSPVEVPEDIVDGTDWQEIRELVTDSYRRLAPKELTALLG